MTYDSHWDAIKPHASSSIWGSFVPSAAFTQGKNPIGLANSHHILLFDGQVHYSIYIYTSSWHCFQRKSRGNLQIKQKTMGFLLSFGPSIPQLICYCMQPPRFLTCEISGWLCFFWVTLVGYGWFWLMIPLPTWLMLGWLFSRFGRLPFCTKAL